VRCDQFTTELLKLDDAAIWEVPAEHLLIVLDGKGTLGEQPIVAGEVWHVPADAGPLEAKAAGHATFLRTRAGLAEA
jgi:hypothetical protein